MADFEVDDRRQHIWWIRINNQKAFDWVKNNFESDSLKDDDPVFCVEPPIGYAAVQMMKDEGFTCDPWTYIIVDEPMEAHLFD